MIDILASIADYNASVNNYESGVDAVEARRDPGTVYLSQRSRAKDCDAVVVAAGYRELVVAGGVAALRFGESGASRDGVKGYGQGMKWEVGSSEGARYRQRWVYRFSFG